MGRRVSAKDRYFETGKAMDRVIDEAAGRFAATAQGRRGHLPRNEAERREMSRLDWPLVGFWDAYDKAMAEAKRVMNGTARHENRGAENRKTANAELIEILQAKYPDLLTADLRGRVAGMQKWLRKVHPEIRQRDDEALAKAIRRAAKRIRFTK